MSIHRKEISKNLLCVAIILSVLVTSTRAPASIVTTIYEFVPEQSTVTVYGRPSVPSIFHVEGQFQLSVDYGAGSASFNWVITNQIWGVNIGDIFYMTEMKGTVLTNDIIVFLSKSEYPSWPYADILLELTFADSAVHLKSSTFYPRYAPDSPFYALDAVAVPEPTSLLLIGTGFIINRRRN